MKTELKDYQASGQTSEAYIASNGDGKKKPAVMIAHAWAGQGPFDHNVANKLAELGYVGVALDIFGKGVRGDPAGDNSHLIGPLVGNRAELRTRLLDALKFTQSLDEVDASKIAIIGYCFGGLCALDLARTGTDEIKAAVSFHGLFKTPDLGEQKPIKAKILALHGYADPMATPENLVDFGTEMTNAGADWQVHAYGNTYHAFTNPHANKPGAMKYNADADRRSWKAMSDLLAEVFA